MVDFVYLFTPKHLDLMHEQILEAGNDIAVYTGLAAFEFSQFSDHIGTPGTVLELGCGLGRGSIYLNHLLANDARFILADRDGRTSNSGAFNPKEDEFYNDFVLTADFCRLNGLLNFRLFDTEVDDWATLPKADLIFSLCSFGMHVSIERYMERLIRCSTPETTMIFGVREPCYGPGSFGDQFGDVVYIEGRSSGNSLPAESWLILKRPMRGSVDDGDA